MRKAGRLVTRYIWLHSNIVLFLVFVNCVYLCATNIPVPLQDAAGHQVWNLPCKSIIEQSSRTNDQLRTIPINISELVHGELSLSFFITTCTHHIIPSYG